MESKIAMESVPNQINYKPINQYAPRYRFRKIPLFNQGSNNVLIGPTATTQLQFKLGADVYNLKRSFVSYNGQLPASGAAGTYSWLYQDVPELANQVQFTDQGSFPIGIVNFAQNHARISRKLNTKLQDYLSFDPTMALNPNNAVINAVNSLLPAIDSRGGAGVGNLPNVNYLESQYLQLGANNAVFNYARQVPLSCYDYSIFSMDQDQYLGRDMYINLLGGPGTKMMWYSTSATDPTAGATAPTGNITLQNVYLWLAIEVNDLIASSIKDKYLSGGYRMLIPTLQQTRLPTVGTLGTAGSAAFTYILQPSFGLYLQKVFFQACDNTNNEQANLAYECTNYNGQKIRSYQTSMDSNPLQDQYLSCENGPVLTSTGQVGVGNDDWRENSKFCKDTVILNKTVYQTNWFHQDSWEQKSSNPSIPSENLRQGLELNIARTWGVNCNTGLNAGSLNFYITAVIQRELSVTPLEGIMFDISKNRGIQAPSVTTQ